MSEARATLGQMSHHRSEAFNRLILPKCETIIRAIGYRLAYEAAVEAKLDPRIIDLFVATTVKASSAWFVEHGRSCGVLEQVGQHTQLLGDHPHQERLLLDVARDVLLTDLPVT